MSELLPPFKSQLLRAIESALRAVTEELEELARASSGGQGDKPHAEEGCEE